MQSKQFYFFFYQNCTDFTNIYWRITTANHTDYLPSNDLLTVGINLDKLQL